MPDSERPELFAVASFGGHLEQLLRLSPAWSDRKCLVVSTVAARALESNEMQMATVGDCHGGQPVRALRCLAQTIRLFVRHRPACVVSTGALPGLIAAIVGRIGGAHVIWIDSLANTEGMSGSGRFARFVAHDWCSQWPGVAAREGAVYHGSLF